MTAFPQLPRLKLLKLAKSIVCSSSNDPGLFEEDNVKARPILRSVGQLQRSSSLSIRDNPEGKADPKGEVRAGSAGLSVQPSPPIDTPGHCQEVLLVLLKLKIR